nr:DAK2 domain-containing protein [Clostridiales bacterium]
YAGFLSALSGEPVDIEKMEGLAEEKTLPGEFVYEHDFDSLDAVRYGYCAEFIVSHPKADKKSGDVASLRNRLKRIGDSVHVINDLEVIKIHVHTNDPGKALQMALELGEIDDIAIRNMREETRQKLARKAAEQIELKDCGFVSVALGEGFSKIFTDLSVDKVVDGGQTMNPSIEDILQAIDSVPAREVFVLPNNTNIILAAQQAAELTEKRVFVLGTKSVPMGIAAILAYDPSLSGDDNYANMMAAAENVHTASVTYAVRDTVFDGRDIHEGDIMGLVDNKIKLIGSNVHDVSLSVLEDMVTEESSIISVYYGSEVDIESAVRLKDDITAKYTDCDVEVHEGGQPLYYYLIAVE